MNFTVIDVAQRSPEWFAARCGRVTGSRVADVFATRKDNKEAAPRRNLRLQLVLERLTGRGQESTWTSQAMQQGLIREVDAISLYEALTGRLIQSSGFLQSDDLMVGCSLDGHLDAFTGIVECKCPLPATHLAYLRSGIIPDEYQRQIHHQLWITGAAWCDYLSYAAEFPEPLQARMTRVQRDEAVLTAHELAVRLFLDEINRELQDVQRLMAVPA